MQITEMKAEHLLYMKKNRMVEWIDEDLTLEKCKLLAENPYSTTILDDEGSVLMVGGVIEHWSSRAEIWAIFSEGSFRHVVGILPLVRAYVETLPHLRVEAVVVKKFKAAHRFLQQLGFDKEVETLRGYYPTGEDVSMYSRIRENGGSRNGV